MCKKNQLLEKFNNIYTHKKILYVYVFLRKKIPKWVYLPEFCSVDFPLLFNGIIIFQTIKLWNWNPFWKIFLFLLFPTEFPLSTDSIYWAARGPSQSCVRNQHHSCHVELSLFHSPPDSNPPSKVFLLSPNPKSCLKLWSPPSLAS